MKKVLLTATAILALGVVSVGCDYESQQVTSGSQNSSIQAPELPAADNSKADAIKIKTMIVDTPSYYNKKTTVTGVVKVDDYFNFLYDDSKNTHYSFQVSGDDFDYFHAYASRDKFKDLFDYIISKGGEAPVKVTVTTDPNHEDGSIWTLLSWEKV